MPTSEKFVAGFDKVFLEEAAACRERCKHAHEKGHSVGVAGAAASTFVMCAAAGEAFVSERVAYLRRKDRLDASQVEDIVEQDGAHSKMNRLARLLVSEELHRHPDYRPFCCVVKLRNTVVHRNAEYLGVDTWPGELSGCQGIVEHVEGEGLDWTSQILTLETAEWAVTSSESLLSAAAELLPAPPSETLLNVGTASATAEALPATIERRDNE